MTLKYILHIIIDATITLKNYLLYEATAYTFTLTLNVNDNYIRTIGKPREGSANIIVFRNPSITTTAITLSTSNNIITTSTLNYSIISPSSTLPTKSRKKTQTDTPLTTTKRIWPSSTLRKTTILPSSLPSTIFMLTPTLNFNEELSIQ